MKDYLSNTTCKFNYLTEDGEKFSDEVMVENFHFFGNYEGADNGKLVIGRLSYQNVPLFQLAGGKDFSAIELAESAFAYAQSEEAESFVRAYEAGFGENHDDEAKTEYAMIVTTRQNFGLLKNLVDAYKNGRATNLTVGGEDFLLKNENAQQKNM